MIRRLLSLLRRRRHIAQAPVHVPVWNTWQAQSDGVLAIPPARSDYRVMPPSRWNRENRGGGNVSDGNNS